MKDNKKKLPTYTITEKGYVNEAMKKKYKEIMAGREKKGKK